MRRKYRMPPALLMRRYRSLHAATALRAVSARNLVEYDRAQTISLILPSSFVVTTEHVLVRRSNATQYAVSATARLGTPEISRSTRTQTRHTDILPQRSPRCRQSGKASLDVD